MSASVRTFVVAWLAAVCAGCGGRAVATAVDPFVGEWKLDASRTNLIDMMKVQSVSSGTYAFDFGGGSETIAVDGTDQPGISGTTLSVTVEATNHWRVVRKQAGRMLITASWTLGDDGNTLSDDFTELGPDGQVAVHVSYLYRRTAGGAGFAGTWESPIAADQVPSVVLQVRPYEAGGLSFVNAAQDVVKNIKFDGKEYPIVGRGIAPGTTSSARRVSDRSLQVTEKTAGTIRKTEQLELSRDLNTLTRTSHPVGQRGPNVFVFQRQAAKAGSRS